MIFDKIIDSNIEWVGLNERNRENQVKEKTMKVRVVSSMLAIFPNDTQENDCATSYEDLKSLHAESDDEDPKRSTVFTPTRHLDNPKFKFTLNMIFGNSKEFKTKVQGQRQFVRCHVANGSYLHQSLKAMNLSKIKTIGLDHCCGKKRDNKTIDYGVLAKKYVEEVRINSSWGVKEFQTQVMRTHNCTITRTQAYMKKTKTLDLIIGTKEEKFDMLWDYCA
ncbi:hypothetical protein H5410_051914 [Solanum commersonii]|uniref:Uncharacterized protein n=1 Tax=Solanum commersonii TaxID=4109 RepID=A0A9J5X0T3_SOLCO|nr:hypothetical protein H5410_051914 [Solanum commersonii]